MFSCTHTHTRTYKLRCLSTRCIKKWNLFFLTDRFNLKYDSTVAFCPFVARHVPSGLAACHICSSFTKFTTLHTRLTRRMCALCTRRVDRPCVCVHMTRASTTWPPASCSLFHLHTVLISISNIYFPLYLASSASSARRRRRYCRLQITVNNRTERNICPPLCRTTS